MQPFSRAIMTDAGSRLSMKAQAGEAKIQFTKIAVGDGIYTDEERKISSQQIQTALKSQKNSYPMNKIEVVSDHSVKLTALITNYDPISETTVVENGYYINEMGLFAKENGDEENETEVLYSIAIVESETGDFMPPFDGNNPAQIIQEYYATVSNAEEVTIELGKGAVALAEDLEKITVLDFDDSGEVEDITSFTDFIEKFVKGTSMFQFLTNLKAGLKYVLHTGKLVNSGMCETPGEFALDAAYGKTLTDQITGLYSDITAPGDTLFVFDYQNGKYGYNLSPTRGADTFVPFSGEEAFRLALYNAIKPSGIATANMTHAQMCAALAKIYGVPPLIIKAQITNTNGYDTQNTITITVYVNGTASYSRSYTAAQILQSSYIDIEGLIRITVIYGYRVFTALKNIKRSNNINFSTSITMAANAQFQVPYSDGTAWYYCAT